MVRMFFNMLLFVLVSAQLTAQNISIRDFVIPESRYKNMFGTIQGNFGSTRQGNPWYENESQRGDYGVSLKNLNGFNSEQTGYYIETSGEGNYTHSTSSEENRGNYWSPRTTNKQSTEAASVSSTGQYSWYAAPDQIYLYGSGAITGAYSMHHNESDTNNVILQSWATKDRDLSLSIGGGVGIGKMREASAVYTVVRIIEKFQEDGYLTRELTREEILDIVSIYAKQIEYSSSYERPVKYLLDDLFAKLETMGVLKDKRASAYEVARVAEVFQEFIFPRFVGWTIQAGMTLGRNQSETSGSQSMNSRYTMISDHNYFGITASFGYPFSLSLHAYTIASLSLPVYGRQKRAEQVVQSSLYYQVGEKVSNELSLRYSEENRYQIGPMSEESYWYNNRLSIRNTMRYFVENNVNFSIAVNYDDYMRVVENDGPLYRYTNPGISIIFGFNYRFF